MIDESNHISFRRYADVFHPALGLVQNSPYWIFKLILPLNQMNDRQIFSVWRPISFENIFHYFARCASNQRHAGERSVVAYTPVKLAIKQDGHLAGRRN